MQISERGLDLIKSFEGCRLIGYADIVGVPTIGYGNTCHATVGVPITQAQADAYLLEDLRTAQDGVNKLVKVPVTQGQFDALVSFAFNFGVHALETSRLLRTLNFGNTERAAAEFLRWDHAGGKKITGLTRRREAEVAMFRSQDVCQT